MGDEARFSEKWDFRRHFGDSSSDDPDSYSTHEPIIHNPSPVLDLNQLDNGTKTVTGEQPVKSQKRRSKNDESKPEKAKQVRRRKPNINVCEEEKKKKEETAMETDDVGIFMKTLLDDLTASRESLMNWMNTELNGSSNQNVVSPPPRKRGEVAAVSVKKRRTKKKGEEKDSKQDMNKLKEKSSEVVQKGGDQVRQLDYNAGPLDTFEKQEEQGQQGILAQTEIENATAMNKKSVVLAIEAPKVRQGQKKTREANTIKNRSETQKDDNFAIPYVPQLSSSPTVQSFTLGSSLFPLSSQGVTSLASNNNYQPPVVPQFSDLYEFQTGGQGCEKSSLFHNNGYFSGFPAASPPNLMAQVTYSQQRDNNNMFGGLQMNPTTYSQQRDNNSMFGELQMAGGAISHSGSRFPESHVGNGNNSLLNYRTGSGR